MCKSDIDFRGKTTVKLNDCFLGKSCLAKNFKMVFRGGEGGKGEQKFSDLFSKLRGKTTVKLNDCFLGKTSLAKNFRMVSRGGGGEGGGTKPCFKT